MGIDGKARRHQPTSSGSEDGVMAAIDTSEVAGPSAWILESCHSLWLFEPGRMRFRRLPRGVHLDTPAVDRDWTAYQRLDVDLATGMFVIALNPDGTQLLRAWVHDNPCRHCADATAEFSVAALREALDTDVSRRPITR
jgi:hypothetical protein